MQAMYMFAQKAEVFSLFTALLLVVCMWFTDLAQKIISKPVSIPNFEANDGIVAGIMFSELKLFFPNWIEPA